MGFSIADNPVDWSMATKVTTFGTANPVFRLVSAANEVLFAKLTKPGEGVRSGFATDVVQAAGLRSYRHRVVLTASAEGQAIVARIRKIGDDALKQTLNKALLDPVASHEILIMDDVKGQTQIKQFQDHWTSEQDKILEFMRKPNFKRDLGRMIAADAIIGNWDRVSYEDATYKSWHPLGTEDEHKGTKLHGGNFFVDPISGDIIPIDNDAVLFEIKNLRKKTKDEWFRMLIKGGALSANNLTFTVQDYPSLDHILSPNLSADTVKKIITLYFKAELTTNKADMNQFCQDVALSIREGVLDILAKLKNGQLNKKLQALQEQQKLLDDPLAAEGLNYEAFKIKTRYAKLVTDLVTAKKDVDDAAVEKQTKEYAEYREWKQNLMAIPMPMFDLGLPTNITQPPGKRNAAQKLLDKAAHATAGQAYQEGQTAKRLVRAGAAMQDLRKVLRMPVTTFRGMRKAHFEATLKLTTLLMDNLAECIDTMLDHHVKGIYKHPLNVTWTPLYVKALKKHAEHKMAAVGGVIKQYEDYVAKIKGKLTADSDFDQITITACYKSLDNLKTKGEELKTILNDFYIKKVPQGRARSGFALHKA